jgi:hypothetical protein
MPHLRHGDVQDFRRQSSRGTGSRAGRSRRGTNNAQTRLIIALSMKNWNEPNLMPNLLVFGIRFSAFGIY